MTELTGLAQLAPVLGVVGLVGALTIYLYIVRQSTGTELMTELAGRIQEGAMAFLKREYSVLAVFVIVVAVLLFFANQGAGTQLVAVSFLFSWGIVVGDRNGGRRRGADVVVDTT